MERSYPPEYVASLCPLMGILMDTPEGLPPDSQSIRTSTATTDTSVVHRLTTAIRERHQTVASVWQAPVTSASGWKTPFRYTLLNGAQLPAVRPILRLLIMIL